jgi:toxin CptA
MPGPVLTFDIAPSRWLRLAVAMTHVLAGMAVLMADLRAWLQGVILVLVTASLAWSMRRGSLIELRCQPDGRLAISAVSNQSPAVIASEARQSSWLAVEVRPETVVLPWLVVLRYRCAEGGRTQTAAILPDSLDEDDFRRLRVWLKWRAVVRSAAEAPVAGNE